MRIRQPLTVITMLVALKVSSGFACEIRLISKTPTCPAVSYTEEDCDKESLSGSRGEIRHFTILNVMSSGAVFAGGNHEGAVELRYLTFKGCAFKFVDRDKEESPEYISHFLIQ